MDINYSLIREKINDADAVIIGASNGLSITEGFQIFADNDDFRALFGDLRDKYGICSPLQGFFFNWPTDEERWVFLSRLINHYSGSYTGSPVMDALKTLVAGKPYFILTSNGENHFELAGFDPACILEIEGSWKEMRCASGCHDTLYPTWDAVRKMAAAEKDAHIPAELIPRCPHCGGSMVINMQPKQELIDAFNDFAAHYHNKKLLVLELGIGARNQLIKAPLMRLVNSAPNAFYITFNKGEIFIPPQIAHKSIGVDGLLGDILPKLANN